METLEIPPELYQALLRAARESGTTPLGWIAAHLPSGVSLEQSLSRGNSEDEATKSSQADARLFAFSGAARSQNPRAADNATIDADLYG